jgi:hypothetical protein
MSRLVLILIAAASVVFAGSIVTGQRISKNGQQPSVVIASTTATPKRLSDNSTYYTVRRDRRKCMSPMCGGYFVKRVNVPTTLCADGRAGSECYVAEIDWNGQAQVDINKALLRGTTVLLSDKRFGKLGHLKVTESWQAASDDFPIGDFYRTRDRGLRCITFPCPTHLEAKLNSIDNRSIAGVDLAGAHAADTTISDAFQAMTSTDGVMVAGQHVSVKGPAGKSESLKASQFYLRSRPATASKPCVRTGCSQEVCADRDVITACIWREEYSCYQKAKCERQADGSCGFTPTPELASCLRRTKP